MMKIKVKKITSIILTFLILFSLLPSFVFANTSTSSELDFEVVTDRELNQPEVGDVFPVNVLINGVNNVYGIQYQFEYDSNVLELVDANQIPANKGELGEVLNQANGDIIVLQNEQIQGEGTKKILNLAVSYKGDVSETLLPTGTVATYYFRWISEEVKETNLSWVTNSVKLMNEEVELVPVIANNKMIKSKTEPTTSLFGSVTTNFISNNNWGKDVQIYLTNDEKNINEVVNLRMLESGMVYDFSFENLPLGTYKLTIDGSFYLRVNKDVVITEDHIENGYTLETILLEPKESLSKVYGTVLNENNDKLSNAYINIWSKQGYYWNQAVSDESGEFTFDVPYDAKTGSVYHISVWHQEYLPYENDVNVQASDINLDNSSSPIILSLGNTASGKVVDSNGNAITDTVLEVYAYDRITGSGWANTTVSHIDGTFTLTKLVGSSNYVIEIIDPSGLYVNSVTRNVDVTNSGTDIGTIELKKSAKVIGKVSDSSGTGIENVFVTLYNDDFSVYGFGRTNIDGNYELKGLSVIGNQSFNIETYNYQDFVDIKEDVSLSEESTTTHNFTLYKRGESFEVFSNPDDNSLKVNKTTVSPNETITYQVKYKNNNVSEQEVENANIVLTYPQESSIVAARSSKYGDIIVDGVIKEGFQDNVSIYPESHSLSLTFDKLAYLEEGTLTVQVRVRGDLNREMTLSAHAKGYYQGNEIGESFGNALTSLAFVTFKAPNVTSNGELTVYGEAISNAEVYIYEGKANNPDSVRLLATAKTNGKYWSKSIKLINSMNDIAEEHVLYVRSKLGDQWSNPSKPIKVLYDATIPKVIDVNINAGWNKNVTTNPYIGVPSMAVTETTPIYIDIAFDGIEKMVEGSQKIEFLGKSYSLTKVNGRYQAEVPYGWRGAGEESITLHYNYQSGSEVEVELPLVQILILIDPSGIVTDKVTGKPIQGIKATVEKLDENDGQYYQWDAELYGQVNPQYTDADGYYGWDVPEGKYRVRFTDPNGIYLSTIADDNGTGIVIPPPRTDVDVALVKNTKPTIIKVLPEGEEVNTSISVEITFSEWMDKNTVDTTKLIVKDVNENIIEGTFSYLKNSESAEYEQYHSINNAFNVLKWTPDNALDWNQTYSVTIDKELVSDLYGHPLTSGTGWVFTTSSEPTSGGGSGGGGIIPGPGGNDTISEEIKALAGGTVELSGVARVIIPDNALSVDGTIQIAALGEEQEKDLVNAGQQLMSSIVEITNSSGDLFNQPLTISINYDPKKVTNGEIPAAYYYNEVNKKWIFIGGDVKDNQIHFTTNHLTKFAVFSYKELALKDLDNHWANQYAKRLIGLGVINGFDDQTFKPDENVTRAQFAKMLVEALDLELSSTENLATVFADNDQIPEWAKPYILTAFNNKLILGYEGGNGLKVFKPDQLITRAEMAVMIARGFNQDLDNGNKTKTSFADDSQIPVWAKSAININFNHQIVNGYQEDNTFRPNNNATRAEAAKMIYMLLEALHY